jgi:molecular chaperone DnaK
MKTEPVIGIDLGTTHSLVGVMDAGFTVLIPDSEGRRLLPSVLSWPKEGAEPVLGYHAKRARSLAPERTIYSSKRFMGRRFTELSLTEKTMPYPVLADGQGRAVLQVAGKELLPQEMAAFLLKELVARAERYLEQPVKKAVITVPAYFNDAQRQATKEAGERAGLEVLRILSEPTAAALAYGADRQYQRAKLAVYDLGGGTFDLSLLELNEGVFQVLATSGNTQLGGDDIDQAVYEFFLESLPQVVREQKDPVVFSRLKEEAEQAKIRLSLAEEILVEIPFLTPEYHFKRVMKRGDLERLARPLLEVTKKHCLRALQDAGLQASDLQTVLLVGGQTRMPLVRELVKEWFGHEPDVSLNPDEAVAQGAVIQAGILSGVVQNKVLLDVTPLSLGLETFGGLMNVIIPRNSSIPTKAGELFTNAVDGQRLMKIKILQGERELARDNWLLGELDLPFPPGPRATARVGVQFELDADGILHVLARDTVTMKEEKIELRSVVDVSDERVEQMVADSVECALEDMQERRWIEAQLKARRLIELTGQALTQVNAAEEPELVEPVLLALEDLEKALEAGVLSDLQTSMKKLDQSTQPLATYLMDKAMEEALARKGLI